MSTGLVGSKDIAIQAAKFYRDNNTPALKRLAHRYWPKSLNAPLKNGAGELFRYTFIRSREEGLVAQHLWRARALASAVICNERDTAAGLILQTYFGATAMALEGKALDAVHGYRQARLILDEIKRLVPEKNTAWPRLYARLYHEKRGLSFLLEATGGRRPLPRSEALLRKARAEYRHALTFNPEGRDQLKVQAGLALVEYLELALHPASPSASRPMLDKTKAIHVAARKAGNRDVANWAATNLRVMQRRKFVGWVPYEIL